MQSLNSVAHSASYHPRPSGAPDVGHAHHDRGAASVLSADASAQALRSCRGCSAALLTPTQPGIRDTSGSDAPLDSLLRRNPVPAVPIAPLGCVTPSGGPIRVQHDIQPGAIDTGVTATVALRLDADRVSRTGWLAGINRHGQEVPFTQHGDLSGWRQGAGLGLGSVTADLADHNPRPDDTTVRDETPQSFIASPEGGHTMQTPRFSTVMVEKAEDLLDYVRYAASDGEICQTEIRTIDVMADDLYRHTQVNDANQADIIARLRTGPDSQRVQVTGREVRNSLRLIEGNGERLAGCTPPDAA